ncbi:1,3-beta-glucanosyltransferase gas1 [Ascosphaera pollenicola]|nr:1,3-beta-glucanosyltransferase gas1 [Ascosphaera pollenicola]
MRFSTVLASAALSATALAAIDPIVIKGSKLFYKSNGTEFFMRGVAYQQDTVDAEDAEAVAKADVVYQDPLADTDACKRDIPYLQQLRTNTIRVYAVDPAKDHDKCMNALADAGIYVVADLSEPSLSINRDSPSWDVHLYKRYTSVIDALAKYDNTLGFFAGNEVSNNVSNTDASAFVKAAVRDSKAYIKSKGYREMGVGYATNDDADIRVNLAHYFNCGDKTEENVDFWGYNVYSWCGDSSFTKAGWDVLVKNFSDYSVPMFFAEYGCNKVQPRPFTEVKTLYGDQMTGVVSGGIVYMYFQETNEYGLVKVSGNKVTTLDDFDNLKKQIETVSPKGVKMSDYKPENSPGKCPFSSDWLASSKLAPTPNSEACKCKVQSLGCKLKSNVSKKKYPDLFDTIYSFGSKYTADIYSNGTSGLYGAFSMCDASDQLSIAIDSYYQHQVKKSSAHGEHACDFDGAAETQSAKKPSGTCDKAIKSAVAAATSTPTGGVDNTHTDTNETDTSSSSSASASATESGAAGILRAPSVGFSGLFGIAAYVATAMLAGAGTLLL